MMESRADAAEELVGHLEVRHVALLNGCLAFHPATGAVFSILPGSAGMRLERLENAAVARLLLAVLALPGTGSGVETTPASERATGL